MRLILCLLLGVAPLVAHAQHYPLLDWQKFYGGVADDTPYALQLLPDSTLVLAGSRTDTVGCHRGWVLGLAPDGAQRWEQLLGKTGCAEVRDLCLSTDGADLLFAGTTGENLVHTESQTGEFAQDYWVGKLDLKGNVLWHKNFGGAKPDQAMALAPTALGGCAVVGSSWSKDHDVTTSGDLLNNNWVLMLNRYGQHQRNISLGGSKNDWGTSACATQDGGLMMLAYTTSENLDDSKSRTNGDAWLIKMRQNGDLEWQRVLKEPYEDILLKVVENKYGLLAAVGSSFSADGAKQFWFVKFDKTGRLLVDKKWGGKGYEELSSLATCADGGYIACGYSHYYNLENPYIKGQRDLWVIRMNSEGDIVWQQTYGGPDIEEAVDIIEFSPNVYYVLGRKKNTFEANKAKRGYDFWLLKLTEKPCNSLEVYFETNNPKNKAEVGQNILFVNKTRLADRFEWDFGDGTKSTETSPNHSYAKPGIYTVRLTAFLNESCSRTYLYPAPIQIK